MVRATVIAASLAFVGCSAEGPVDDVNVTGGVATSGGGNPYDGENPGLVEDFDPAKADTTAYEVPADLPELVEPRIVVSLEGFTVELVDDETGFYKVYPAGVGALGSSGRSYTPTGQFRLGSDPGDGWWWYRRRSNPSYFAGLPFLRFDAVNSRGQNTYGFHGPITETLIRGFVSHGCVRMEGADIVELFYLMLGHPGAPVTIQHGVRYHEDGTQVDVTPPEADPVRLHRERTNSCVDDAFADGDVLGEGAYGDLGLCDGEDRFAIAVAQGDRVVVTAAAGAPVRVSLAFGDADAIGEPTVDADGVWHSGADLRVPEAGEVELKVGGEPGTYGLDVVIEPFEG